MSLRIFHRNVYLLVLVLTLLVCFGVGTSYGNVLAEKVYIKHRPVFARADVQGALPGILEQLGTPAVQKLLTPASIPLVVENPELLKPAVPGASPEFIASMKEDAALQKLLQDADFQELLQNPVAINVLVAFITGEMEPKESWVRFRSIGHPENVDGESVSLVPDLKLGTKYLAGSQHTLILTLTYKRTGKPVAFVRFTLEDPVESTIKTTFSPATITTDKNGKAETQITVGRSNFGVATNAFVPTDAFVPEFDPWVRFVGLGYPENVDGERFSLVSNLKSGTKYLAGSQHTLILTLTNERTGQPVPSVPLTLYPTNVTVSPATITTDKNGKAETQITVGDRGFSFNVAIPPKGPTFGNYDFSSLFVDGEELDLQLDGLVSQRQYHQRSRHKVTFTVRKQRTREPVPFVRLSLRASEHGSTLFTPWVITTDKNGKAETYITFPRKPGSVVINISVHMEHEKRVTYKRQISGSSHFDGEVVDVSHDLRTNVAYRPGSKRKVIFTVRTQKSNKPVFALLTLSAHPESTTTATFSPAVIVTDENGKAETQITFGEKPGSISIDMRMRIDYEATHVILKSISYYAKRYTNLDVDLETNFSSPRPFIPGSQHKLILTLTDRRTGKPFPSAGISVNVRDQSTTTATFSPAVVITDGNGKAETQVTFGEKPGGIFIDMDIRKSRREAFFNLNRLVSGGEAIEIDVMHDDKSERLSKFSYSLGFTETRKKLVVKTRSFKHGHTIPYVDLVFKDGLYDKAGTYGIATFEPKQVRTDENGQAVIDITFPAGIKDFQTTVEVNMMVLVQVNLNEADNLIPYPYVELRHEPDWTPAVEMPGGVNGMKHLTFQANGRDIPALGPNSGAPVMSNSGVFPLNASAHVRFNASTDFPRDQSARSPLFFINSRTNTDTNLHQSYAAGSSSGLVTVRMNTGSKPGVVVLNLNPPNAAQLKGTIRIVGREKVGWLKPGVVDFDQSRNLNPLTIVSQEEFKLRYKGTGGRVDRFLGAAVNSVRVEVFIKSRKISTTGVEIGAYAKFYEGRTRDTKDLDDVDFLVFKIPWDARSNSGLQLNANFTSTLPDTDGHEASRVLGLSHLWSQTTPEENDRYRVNVYLDLEAVPIHNGTPLTSVFGAPTASTANLFTFSDVNADGQVNVRDLILVSNALEQTDLANLRADVNNDGIFTIADLIQVAQHLGQSAGSGTPAALVVPAELTYTTVEEWIASARAVDDGSLVFREGIAKLAYLLMSLIPEKTTLLANYPNPFNPETWIPYHLAKPADVTLTIYAIDGKVVRRLDLGHQAAGYYQSKARAAYWDGRNNVGERVASGIYFYTLTTGDFAATQKMLILK